MHGGLASVFFYCCPGRQRFCGTPTCRIGQVSQGSCIKLGVSGRQASLLHCTRHGDGHEVLACLEPQRKRMLRQQDVMSQARPGETAMFNEAGSHQLGLYTSFPPSTNSGVTKYLCSCHFSPPELLGTWRKAAKAVVETDTCWPPKNSLQQSWTCTNLSL